MERHPNREYKRTFAGSIPGLVPSGSGDKGMTSDTFNDKLGGNHVSVRTTARYIGRAEVTPEIWPGLDL